MKPFADRLAAGDILIADGATGTLLFERGLEPGGCPESFALDNPELLTEIATSYLAAGADIVEACTFGGSPLKLSAYGLDDRTEEINETAVRSVRTAVGDRAYVAGSVGPCGKLLKPYGDASPEDVHASFRRQAESLVGAGIDCVVIETMIDLAEAKLAIKAFKDVSPSIPIAATMTFDSTPNGFFTIMGVSVEAAVVGLTDAGADVVGSNCGNGIEKMVEIATVYRAATDMPLIIQSNAGLPEVTADGTTYPETPGFMAEKAEELRSIGVSIIGGCCGTTPEHVKALRKVVDGGSAE